MKKVVSVSLGSSKRNHAVETEILGEKFYIERIGTDGDKKKVIRLIEELDGKVDAFGMGGTDLYLYAGDRRYILRDSLPIARAAKKTPVVDGSGLKNTLERKVVHYLLERDPAFRQKKVLLVCGVDRFGMAQAFSSAGCSVVYGDIIFSLGLPIPLYSLKTLEKVARALVPIICYLPIKYLYPTGEKQEKNNPRFHRFFDEAEVVAGDFHFISRNMPSRLDGKIILTNTVTKEDVENLRSRGVDTLITTTPELNGRSFGTNVMEAALVSLLEKPLHEIKPEDYEEMLDKIGFIPRIEKL